MTKRQSKLDKLCILADMLFQLSDDCTEDPRLNELVASLGIFSKSLDDAGMTIIRAVGQEVNKNGEW